ncbi:PREDICTED: cysteine-rich protein 3 isoform X4 [Rhinopithecus bieti]|uniref:cysteine-rich protein 3 isoform X4 n=1 Tax=Rhinopithecus bieti TaxID=61621 RepID=UPI00083C2F4E|nr:PREDICTED: cysteine-rich protein 3 isoform X4 [Rhinopithecus bieti]
MKHIVTLGHTIKALQDVRSSKAFSPLTHCKLCESNMGLTHQAEKVSSLGKNWHRFCLKCERCHSVLSPGGHAEHNGRPYCHKPCYGALFGPRGVNIGGVGSYLYNAPTPSPGSTTPLSPSSFSPPRPRTGLPQGKKSPPHMKTFTGETSLCPGCGEPVYFEWKHYHFSPPPAEKVMSLGRNWHRPCLRCQRCRKTLTAGSHAEARKPQASTHQRTGPPF